MQHHPRMYARPVCGPNTQKDDARWICKTSAMSPCTSTTLPPLSAPCHCQDQSNDQQWTQTRSWSWGGLRKAWRVRASVPSEWHKTATRSKGSVKGQKPKCTLVTPHAHQQTRVPIMYWTQHPSCQRLGRGGDGNIAHPGPLNMTQHDSRHPHVMHLHPILSVPQPRQPKRKSTDEHMAQMRRWTKGECERWGR
jgi:hypothetical protein